MQRFLEFELHGMLHKKQHREAANMFAFEQFYMLAAIVAPIW